MAVGATDHIWDLRELLDALLNVEPCEAPTKQPLASRVPEATHRELPNGKGFLRVIDGGKGKTNDAPKVPPTPPQPVRYAAAVVEDYEKHWQEMDAKLWKQREKRMDFFGDDGSDDDCPY
jgi:hypothetical protein